jgi:hypothetical protein
VAKGLFVVLIWVGLAALGNVNNRLKEPRGDYGGMIWLARRHAVIGALGMAKGLFRLRSL